MLRKEDKKAAEDICCSARIPIPTKDIEREICKSSASVVSCIWKALGKKSQVRRSKDLQNLSTGVLDEGKDIKRWRSLVLIESVSICYLD